MPKLVAVRSLYSCFLGIDHLLNRYKKLANRFILGMPCQYISTPFSLYDQSLGELVKELVTRSWEIYSFLLSEYETYGPITVICPGQSPAYIALSMIHLQIYDKSKVEILVLPHSKGGCTTCSLEERYNYGRRLREKGVEFRPSIYILDTVNSGAGVRALENTLQFNQRVRGIIRILAVNHPMIMPFIPVYKCFTLVCMPRLSETLPRIVQHYLPSIVEKEQMMNYFINLDANLYAEMIKDVSASYNVIPVEENMWYKLNAGHLATVTV